MKMKVVAVTDNHVELRLDDASGHTITIHCNDAAEGAEKVSRAVNMHEALVSALTPFRSSEMGALLVDMIDMREVNGEEAQKRLSHLINMIDVILDAAEAEEHDDADAG